MFSRVLVIEGKMEKEYSEKYQKNKDNENAFPLFSIRKIVE